MEKTMLGYENELKKLVAEGKQNTTEYTQRKEAITKLNTEMVAMRKEAGLQALSLKELKSLQAQLRNELARAIPGSEHRVKLEREMAAINARVGELTQGSKKTGSSFGGMADGFNKYFGIITAVAASLTGLVFSFRQVVDTFNEFEKKLDNLSALTGLTGENLAWLSNSAKEMSTGMIEGNVRITQSADAIVDAYTKVGSARPELLKNKEDLNMVTQEAIILSEAANTELQPAVNALTGVLNQFNAPASESRRIINALAAGSKEGAGEIPYLTEAIEKSGTVAADAGLSIEELVGTLETLAPRMAQPEMAGRSLRAVILKLQEGAKDTNPALVGMTTAIENLGKKNLSVTELVKMFGVENITTAKILINNVGEMKKYTTAVTGTSVALEQAATNTDNNSSMLAQAQNRVQLLSIELGEKLAPALTFSTNAFSYLMKAILGTITFFNNHRAGVLSALAAVAAYTVMVYGAIAVEKAYAAVIWLADAAQKALNTTMKSNPWGLVAAAVAAAITFLVAYRKNVDEISESTKRLNQIKDDAKVKSDQELAGAKAWFDQLQKSNAGTKERQSLINAINERYGTTLKNMSDEKAFLAQIDATYQTLISSIKQKIALDSRQKTMTELVTQQNSAEEWGKRSVKIQEDRLMLPGVNQTDVRKDIEKAKKALDDTMKEYDAKIQAVYDESAGKLSGLNTGTKDVPTGDPPGAPDYEKNKKIAKEYTDYLLKIKKDLEDAAVQLVKDGQDKELKLNELDYQLKIELITGMSADEIKLKEAYWKEAKNKEDEINKKYSDTAIANAIRIENEKWKAIIDADEKGGVEWLIDSMTLLDKQQEIELSNLKLTEQEKLDIVAKYEAERKKILGTFETTVTDKPRDKRDDKSGNMMQTSGASGLGDLQLGEKRNLLKMQRDMELQAAKDSAEGQAQIWKEYRAAQLAATMAFINESAQVASQIISALSGVNSAMSEYENAQLKKDEDSNNKKKDNLKKQLDSKKITQKQYDASISKMDLEMDAKKKELAIKQGKRNKALAVAQAIINVAQAITSAFATSGNPIFGIIMAALVGVLGAVQIGYILSTPIPEAAKGRYGAIRRSRQAAMGRYDVLGQDDNKQYRGVPYLEQPPSGVYGTPTLFAETGREIILNPKHTENLMRFRPDLVQAIMSVPQRAGGLYPDAAAQRAAAGPVTVAFDKETLDTMRAHTEAMKKPLEANIIYDTMKYANDTVAMLEKNVTR